MWFAGPNLFLEAVAAVTSVSSTSNREGDNQPKLYRDLLALGKAFDQGLIPCQRLLELLVQPFHEMASTVIEESTDDRCMDEVLRVWGKAVFAVFSDDHFLDAAGVAWTQPVLQPHKRSELIKALMKEKLEEVRF